jgi:hypothetical protein
MPSGVTHIHFFVHFGIILILVSGFYSGLSGRVRTVCVVSLLSGGFTAYELVWFSNFLNYFVDRLCGLVVRVPEHRSRGPGFDFRRHQIFEEVVSLEWGPLSLVSIIEELHECKCSASGSRKPRLTAVGSVALTSGGRSVGIVRMRTKVTKLNTWYSTFLFH